MTEILFKKELENELSAFQGDNLGLESASGNISSKDVTSLKTSIRFIEEHYAIIQLLRLYERLIDKDISDIREMKNTVETIDQSISGSL